MADIKAKQDERLPSGMHVPICFQFCKHSVDAETELRCAHGSSIRVIARLDGAGHWDFSGIGDRPDWCPLRADIKAKVIEDTNGYLLFWAAPPPDFEPADYPGYGIRLISPGQCRYVPSIYAMLDVDREELVKIVAKAVEPEIGEWDALDEGEREGFRTEVDAILGHKLVPVGGAHMYYADPSFMAALREGGVEDE